MSKRIIKDKSFLDTKTNLVWYDDLGLMTPKYANNMIENMNQKEKNKWRLPTSDELIELFNVYDHKNKDFMISNKTKHSNYFNVYSAKNKIYMKETILSSNIILVKSNDNL